MIKIGQGCKVTFPLVLDVILHIEVDGDVGSHAGRPAFSNLGLGHLHDGEGGDGLRHPRPPAEHHSTVLRLPVKGRGEGQTQTGDRESDERCGRLSRRKPTHGATAYLFTFCRKQTRKVPTWLDIMGTLIMLSNGFPNAAQQMPQSFNKR